MHLKTAAAAKAAGVPLGTLQRWLERGTVKMMSCDLSCSGSGTARGFSRRRILQLAVMAEITKLGISPTAAAKAAFQFSDHSSTSREPIQPIIPKLGKRYLLVPGSGQVRIADVPPDGTLDAALLNVSAAYIIDLTRTVRDTDERIATLTENRNET